MDEIYTGVVGKIQKLLSVENTGKSISFTTDCWSGSNEALMGSWAVTAVQRLSKIQEELGVPQHSIIQAVQTRWNSTLHMLLRMIEQKRAIIAYSSDNGHFSCLSAE